MSTHLEKARQLAAAGKYRAAVDSLYYALPAVTAGELDEGRAVLDLLDIISENEPKLQGDCNDIQESVHRALDREGGIALELREQSMVFLDGCVLIGGAGIPAAPGVTRRWRLAFTADRVVLLPSGHVEPSDLIEIGWDGLELAIGGAGEVQTGGGFIGGGFGLTGMAVGMITATALNTLTTSSHIDTVLHLQTQTAEVYLFYGSATPEALRMSLSPVFLKLRQLQQHAPASAAPAQEHVVDSLHRLAELLDRGLIDESEFMRLKADLMGRL